MIDCIIPAAGTSSRMSSWKLFLPLGDLPVIDHVLESAAQVADHLIVVSGYRSQALEEHLRSSPQRQKLSVWENPIYHTGMFSSIQEGVRHSSAELLFIMLADLPLVTASTYRMLLDHLRSKEAPPDIIQPSFGGVPGHPVLLQGPVRELILTLPPTASMREVFAACSVEHFRCGLEEIIMDADTPEAYEAILSRYLIGS
jgi:molybdenum cofactor cytidylyltransferase